MNIFLMHRDLRIQDNIAFIELIKKTKNVYIFFIFNDTQIKNNKIFNEKAFNFMVFSLQKMAKNVKINFFQAADEEVVFNEVIQKSDIENIYTNFDFTPFASKRTKLMQQFCLKNKITFKTWNDYLLFKPGEISKINGEPFKVFKSFYQRAIISKKIKQPMQLPSFNALDYKSEYSIDINKFNTKIPIVPYERPKIIKIIQKIDLVAYQKRDYWIEDANNLATALKFGIISCREFIYHACMHNPLENNNFIRQFLWKEFYYHLYYLSTEKYNYNFGQNYLKKFEFYDWENNLDKLEKWKNGKTGFPLIDAAMKILNETGMMHNRLRMITASFLTKNLNVHWKYGEKYFAQKLIDYDPIVNQASWQWVAGTGFESNPFFRIFNLELQGKKFDPENILIKKTLNLQTYKYPKIVDLKKSREIALLKYKKILSSK